MRLEARLAADGENAAVVHYRIYNDRTAPVQVMDVLMRIEPSGASAPDPERAYVVRHEPDGADVGKYVVPVPEDRDVESPEVPLARPVAPGGSLEGRMRLPVPLTERYPYLRQPPAGPSRRVARLRVLIGIVDTARIEPRRAVFRAHPVVGGLFIPEHGSALRLQEILAVTLELPPPGLPANW